MRKTLKETLLYEIDEQGNIYNKTNGKKLQLKGRQVSLKLENGKRKTLTLKNIVANNLLDNPNNYNKVVCQDENDNNTHPDNLMWAETVYGKPIFDKDTDVKLRQIINPYIAKCTNPESPCYKYYGAKGIEVYQPWVEDTLEFVRWAKSANYKKGMYLLRYDKTKNIEPDNLYWSEENILKLNCEMVDNIKQTENLSNRQIATKYQVSPERIRQIKTGGKLKNCK